MVAGVLMLPECNPAESIYADEQTYGYDYGPQDELDMSSLRADVSQPGPSPALVPDQGADDAPIDLGPALGDAQLPEGDMLPEQETRADGGTGDAAIEADGAVIDAVTDAESAGDAT